MNKSELAAQIALDANLSQDAAKRALDAAIAIIKQEVRDNHEVSLAGFGAFSLAQRAARAGRNPRTGEAVEIAATSVPKFRPGRTFKNEVN